MCLQSNDSFIALKDLIVPIYYEDTDFTGFVYHANYLKYFERAREEGLGRKFLNDLYQQGRHFVVRKLQINYKSATKHGQKLIIKSKFSSKSSLILNFFQEAVDYDSLKVSAVTQLELVLINTKGWPLRIDSELKEKIKYNICNGI